MAPLPSSSSTRATSLVAIPGVSCPHGQAQRLLAFRPPRRGSQWRGLCVSRGRHGATVAMAMPAAQAAGRRARVLVAGGGIGGLVFALAAKRKGFEVVVLERDMSAVRGEGKYRGPIQLQSNALAVLEAVDAGAADQVMDAGCITGNRVNGIVDGVSGSW